MKRNFRKGLAIFLILCLLVNGAAAHELTISQELRKAFAACDHVDISVAYNATWNSVDITNGDLVICGNWIGVRSLNVYHNVASNVYRCSWYGSANNRVRLAYYADYNVWYDFAENTYFRADDGAAYIMPSAYGSRGIYVQLESAEHKRYGGYAVEALSCIQKFDTYVGDIGMELIKKAVNPDKSIASWEINW